MNLRAKEVPVSLGRKFDSDKLRYDLLDPQFTQGVVRVLTDGAKKYEDNNWKHVKPFKDRYYAALMRHISAWRQGQEYDKESGCHHLFHAACCLNFLLWGDNYGLEGSNVSTDTRDTNDFSRD
jgi:hypothetical protein